MPEVPLRQWVLSVPFELRLLLARDPRALTAVGESLRRRSSARSASAHVAAKHYIGDVLAARAPLVAKLALPTRIQLRGGVIDVRGITVPTEHTETLDRTVIQFPGVHGRKERGAGLRR